MFRIAERTRALLQDLGLAAIRAGFGIVLAVVHGATKFPAPGEKFVEGVEKMGFPAPGLFAFLAGFAEMVGGILLALGLATRPAAFLVASSMGVAFLVFHGSDPWDKKELAFLYLVVAVGFLVAGGGRLSLDRLVGWYWGKRHASGAK